MCVLTEIIINIIFSLADQNINTRLQLMALISLELRYPTVLGYTLL